MQHFYNQSPIPFLASAPLANILLPNNKQSMRHLLARLHAPMTPNPVLSPPALQSFYFFHSFVFVLIQSRQNTLHKGLRTFFCRQSATRRFLCNLCLSLSLSLLSRLYDPPNRVPARWIQKHSTTSSINQMSPSHRGSPSQSPASAIQSNSIPFHF